MVANFQEVSSALSIYQPYLHTSTVGIVTIDINGDGLDDLIVPQFQSQSGIGIAMTANCNNRVSVFIMQPDKTFVDQTTMYLNTNDLGACVRKAQVADINGDGRPDVVYATNNEDGRLQVALAKNQYAQLTAIVSTGSVYKVVKFGPLCWYHSVGVGYDINGKAYVTGNGFGMCNSSVYYFDTNATTFIAAPVSNGSAAIAANTFQLMSSNKNKKYTDVLIQPYLSTVTYTRVEGYQKNASGQYMSVGTVDLLPTISIAANFTRYTGETQQTTVLISTYKGINFTGGIAESCQLRITPDSNPVAVFSISGKVVPGTIENGMSIVENNLKTFVAVFKAVSIVNGVLTEIPLNIDNEQTNDNGNFFDCKDVNGDGYEDIVRYPYNVDGLPWIYLNNKAGGFTYYGKSNLPIITKLGWENGSPNASGTSLINDFDHDGYADILLYPFGSSVANSFIKYRFFRGQKTL